jgi:hypothetical protein
MTDAPTDRKLARAVRDIAWGQWSVRDERAMLLGPRGEVREVFAKGDPALLTARKALLSTGQLSAVVYLRALHMDDVLQVSLVEFFHEGERTTHVLLTRAGDQSNWFGVPEQDLDQWIEKRYTKKGGTEEPAEK